MEKSVPLLTTQNTKIINIELTTTVAPSKVVHKQNVNETIAPQNVMSQNLAQESLIVSSSKLSKAKSDSNTLIIHNASIRSGQQIHSKGDLVILGSVHSGGEALAEGNIHIYGTLKGRALCGTSGNLTARIFVNKFDAELVAVGDVFVTGEEVPQNLEGHTTIWIENNKLHFYSFKT